MSHFQRDYPESDNESDASDYYPAGWAISIEKLTEKITNLKMRLENVGVEIDIFNSEDICYEEELGRGTEYIVHATTLQYNGIPMPAAVKRVLRNSEEYVDLQLEEIYLMAISYNAMVVTTLKIFGLGAMPVLTTLQSPGQNRNSGGAQLIILSELAKMNLLQLYQRETIPIHITLNLFSRLAASIHTLHSNKIVHRNLTPENVLVINVSRGPTGDIIEIDYRIIDLGMGLIVFVEQAIKDDIAGSKGYYNPEIRAETPYYYDYDVFSLGVMFSILLNSSEWLMSGELERLRRCITDMQSWNKFGRILYDSTVEKSLNQQNLTHTVAPPVKDMLCEMFEKEGDCKLALLDVLRICRSEGGFATVALHRMTDGVDPTKKYLPDSGIGIETPPLNMPGSLHNANLSIISRICELPKPVESFTVAATESTVIPYVARTRRMQRSQLVLNPRRVDKRVAIIKKHSMTVSKLCGIGLIGNHIDIAESDANNMDVDIIQSLTNNVGGSSTVTHLDRLEFERRTEHTLDRSRRVEEKKRLKNEAREQDNFPMYFSGEIDTATVKRLQRNKPAKKSMKKSKSMH